MFLGKKFKPKQQETAYLKSVNVQLSLSHLATDLFQNLQLIVVYTARGVSPFTQNPLR